MVGETTERVHTTWYTLQEKAAHLHQEVLLPVIKEAYVRRVEDGYSGKIFDVINVDDEVRLRVQDDLNAQAKY